MLLTHIAKCSLISAAIALSLSGCGEGESKASTQVAAKVNKDEISVHQINNILSKTPNIPADQAKQASKQILDKLIEQQLLLQQALEKKVDREAGTVQALEAAKREILARAYLEQVGAAAAKPTPEEIKAYYGQHPELFAERRIYNFNEIVAATKEGMLPKLQEQLGKAKSLNEIAGWLKEQNIPYAANSATKAAEQMPSELLPRFHQMKDGQIGVVPTADRIIIMQLAASRTEAIDEKAAAPLIDQFLTNQRRVELMNKEVKQLREKANIQYLGAYAEATAPAAPAAAPSPAAAAPAPAATAPAAAVPKAADAPAQPAAPAANQGLFDKGIQGIR